MLSDCHLVSVVGVSSEVFSACKVNGNTATSKKLQAKPTMMNKGSQRVLVELLLLGIQDLEG